MNTEPNDHAACLRWLALGRARWVASPEFATLPDREGRLRALGFVPVKPISASLFPSDGIHPDSVSLDLYAARAGVFAPSPPSWSQLSKLLVEAPPASTPAPVKRKCLCGQHCDIDGGFTMCLMGCCNQCGNCHRPTFTRVEILAAVESGALPRSILDGFFDPDACVAMFCRCGKHPCVRARADVTAAMPPQWSRELTEVELDALAAFATRRAAW